MELADYDLKRKPYMVEAKRKTTLEERREIAEYYIVCGNDYTYTAARFDVSCIQAYCWVRKYQDQGAEGFTDRCGHHKTDEKVSEMERLRRKNARIKKQLEDNNLLEQLLKKSKIRSEVKPDSSRSPC